MQVDNEKVDPTKPRCANCGSTERGQRTYNGKWFEACARCKGLSTTPSDNEQRQRLAEIRARGLRTCTRFTEQEQYRERVFSFDNPDDDCDSII